MFDPQNWKSIFFQLNLELGSQFYLCVSEVTTRTRIKINFFFIGEISPSLYGCIFFGYATTRNFQMIPIST